MRCFLYTSRGGAFYRLKDPPGQVQYTVVRCHYLSYEEIPCRFAGGRPAGDVEKSLHKPDRLVACILFETLDLLNVSVRQREIDIEIFKLRARLG